MLHGVEAKAEGTVPRPSTAPGHEGAADVSRISQCNWPRVPQTLLRSRESFLEATNRRVASRGTKWEEQHDQIRASGGQGQGGEGFKGTPTAERSVRRRCHYSDK